MLPWDHHLSPSSHYPHHHIRLDSNEVTQVSFHHRSRGHVVDGNGLTAGIRWAVWVHCGAFTWGKMMYSNKTWACQTNCSLLISYQNIPEWCDASKDTYQQSPVANIQEGFQVVKVMKGTPAKYKSNMMRLSQALDRTPWKMGPGATSVAQGLIHPDMAQQLKACDVPLWFNLHKVNQ